MCLTYFATSVIVAISFGIIYSLELSKRSLLERDDIDYKLIQTLTILASITVTLVNMILRNVVRKMSTYEKHDTWTADSVSIAFKLTAARFVNTSIIPLLINSTFDSWI